MLRKEGDVSEGDIVLIYKYQNHYVLDVITKQDTKYESIIELCKEDKRHTLLYGEKEIVIDMANEEDGSDIKPVTLKQVGRMITEIGLKEATETMNTTVVESTKSNEKNA